MSYAGDITPEEAWKLLSDNPDAVLVDCRTDAEWRFVGVPDISESGSRRGVRRVDRASDGKRNENFVDELIEAGVEPGERPVVFLCRSGNRSIGAAEVATEAGIAPSYNVLDGFEGDLDDSRPSRWVGLARRRICPGDSREAVMSDSYPRPTRPTASARPRSACAAALMRSGFEETAEAMFLTSGYVYRTAAEAEKAFTGELDRYVYSRYGNPTVTMFEERLRLIEGAPACFATATGMAAVFTSLGALLGAGDRLVAARSLFGSCFVVCNEILPRWGVETVFVDGDDLVAVGAGAVGADRRRCSSRRRPTRCSRWSTSRRCPSWRTPRAQKWCWTTSLPHRCCSRAFRSGVDVVVYSGTKHIDGQGRVLGGAILGDKEYIDGPVQKLMRHTGPAMSRVQRLAVAQRPGDAGGAGGLQHRVGATDRGVPGGASVGALGALPVLGVAPAVRPGQAADDRRRNRRHLRARGR